MNAHPMITPLLPLQAPESVAGEYSEDAAQAYTLIWANTLAHLRTPPRVEENVHRYRVGTVQVGLRALSIDDAVLEPLLPELDGRRVTPSGLPVGTTVDPGEAPMQIRSADVEFVPQKNREIDAGALIDWLDALRVASPGRLGSILGELEGAGWICLEGTQYRLTDAAVTQLEAVQRGGLLHIDGLTIARWRGAVDAYIGGNQDLQTLLLESNRIFGVSVTAPLAQIEEMVTGTHTAEDAYALREATALKAGPVVRFPVGMDPERLICQDDPLRERRKRLEAELSEGKAHNWLCLPEMERVAIRLGLEIAKLADDAMELRKFLDSVQFDVRSRWLIGLGADSLPPTCEAATRSYRAWLSRS